MYSFQYYMSFHLSLQVSSNYDCFEDGSSLEVLVVPSQFELYLFQRTPSLVECNVPSVCKRNLVQKNYLEILQLLRRNKRIINLFSTNMVRYSLQRFYKYVLLVIEFFYIGQFSTFGYLNLNGLTFKEFFISFFFVAKLRTIRYYQGTDKSMGQPIKFSQTSSLSLNQH